MKVVVDPKVVNLIRKKGKDSITIWMEGCGSWGGSAEQPFVRMGQPIKDRDDYDAYDVDDITVFVRVDVMPKENDTIYVDYYKLLWMERMVLRGIKI